MTGPGRWLAAAMALPGLVLAGCTSEGRDGAPAGAAATAATSNPTGDAAGPTSPSPTSSAPATTPSATREPHPASDGRPRRAELSIPALDIADLTVVPYRGRTDDAPGTRIQDRGLAASPHGPRGGVGPGGIGNYQVTAHRLSSTQAFLDLPALRHGQRVVVRAGGTEFVYRVVETRETSFRSPASLRRQRAAVPGRPGATPTRAMITLSTCATPEDRAAGNYWSDEFGNPEHRIDKIGVLVRRRAV
ncbi:sortase [Nocardioides panacisoli]|uniref:sortase domain-containing protein n=1 Tax=Nocardioides panacisoli TaxID=627624 RepID=UPI001C625C19|nr:sortase [Nocardioides panacisoli]QYJ05101.1 sortase [Nocardioides panacisoli]